MGTKIKICGISTVAAGLAAIDAGADYLGFVFYPPSPRVLEPEGARALIAELRQARPGGWRAVGVVVNEPVQKVVSIREVCALDAVQLNGEESREYSRQIPGPVIKAVRLGGASAAGPVPTADSFGAERLLIDASVPGRYGGTGVAYDWAQFRSAVADGFLAGGLTPDNVVEAIAAAKPWGVDVSSGVEEDGTKSPALIRAFIEAVRRG